MQGITNRIIPLSNSKWQVNKKIYIFVVMYTVFTAEILFSMFFKIFLSFDLSRRVNTEMLLNHFYLLDVIYFKNYETSMK
jgi:hypothetical protein